MKLGSKYVTILDWIFSGLREVKSLSLSLSPLEIKKSSNQVGLKGAYITYND